MSTGEWISATVAAKIMAVSRQTVLRSLTDPEIRRKEWGEPGQGWRPKPLARRDEYQIRKTWAVAKARGLPPPS